LAGFALITIGRFSSDHRGFESELDVPRHLVRAVHDNYFEPKMSEFEPRTIWSLTNAFTSSFHKLEPISQFKATARLGQFFQESRLLSA